MDIKLERLSPEDIAFNLSFMFYKDEDVTGVKAYEFATKSLHAIIEAFQRQGLEAPEEYREATGILFLRLSEELEKDGVH